MRSWSTIWLWPLITGQRMRHALRMHWRRILAGAIVGWCFAVLGGAFALESLEFHGLVTRTTSDSIGIVTVLTGICAGALIAYAGRPSAQAQRPSGVMKRR